MTLAEVWGLFEDESAEWRPPWSPTRKLPPYAAFTQGIRLNDGARIEATFTSPVNGSVLYVFLYEQHLRDGPSVETLLADLKARYGQPDDIYGSGHYWNYNLVSRMQDTLGAFMRVHYRTDHEDPRKVAYLRLVINDAGLGRHDERAAAHARREAKRLEFEKGKSDKIKF